MKVSKALQFLFVCALAVGLLGSCGSKRVKFDPYQTSVSNEKDGKGLAISPVWLKNKGDTIDVMVILKNNYDKDIQFPYNAWRLKIGEQESTVRRADFSGIIPAGASEKGIVIFEVAHKAPKEGTVTLIIDPIRYQDEKLAKSNLPPLKLDMPLR